jgi:hypothetical protein
MVPMADTKRKYDMDERLSIPLDPETALRGLLQVDPDAEPVDPADADKLKQAAPLKEQGDPLSD